MKSTVILGMLASSVLAAPRDLKRRGNYGSPEYEVPTVAQSTSSPATTKPLGPQYSAPAPPSSLVSSQAQTSSAAQSTAAYSIPAYGVPHESSSEVQTSTAAQSTSVASSIETQPASTLVYSVPTYAISSASTAVETTSAVESTSTAAVSSSASIDTTCTEEQYSTPTGGVTSSAGVISSTGVITASVPSSTGVTGYASSTPAVYTPPAYGGSTYDVSSASSTTMTVVVTQTHTVISCAPTVTNCPADKTAISYLPPSQQTSVVVTDTVVLSTTVCPVEQASSISKSIASEHSAGRITGSTIYSVPTATGGYTAPGPQQTGSSGQQPGGPNYSAPAPQQTGSSGQQPSGPNYSAPAPQQTGSSGQQPGGPNYSAPAPQQTGSNGQQPGGPNYSAPAPESTTLVTATATSYETVTLPKPTGGNSGECVPSTVTATITETYTVPASTVYVTMGSKPTGPSGPGPEEDCSTTTTEWATGTVSTWTAPSYPITPTVTPAKSTPASSAVVSSETETTLTQTVVPYQVPTVGVSTSEAAPTTSSTNVGESYVVPTGYARFRF